MGDQYERGGEGPSYPKAPVAQMTLPREIDDVPVAVESPAAAGEPDEAARAELQERIRKAPGSTETTIGVGDDGLPIDPNDRVFQISAIEDHVISLLKEERLQILQRCAVQTKHGRHTVNADFHMRLRSFLRALKDVNMTPRIKAESKIDQGLDLFWRDGFDFHPEYTALAKSLYDGWQASSWGAGEVTDEVTDDTREEVEENLPAATGKRVAPQGGVRIRRPDPKHPIYGASGIMRGILVKKDRIRTYMLDPNYSERRAAKFYGHNGLQVNDWWPRQLCALRDGAHGVKMGGIAGNTLTGAYSVLVAAGYEGLDDDCGDWLWYSGSDAHRNTNPKTPTISSYTECLIKSLKTRNPVRVFRSHRGSSIWAPRVGLRYDGLYEVVEQAKGINPKGGAFLKFRLVRLGDQPDIDRERPNARELKAESRVEDDY
ncbi:MAG: hypothetical protein M1832_004662 [Thelocarpon impressellum]|nr:MAG: hypothetical protein M1832_004662 [Thelocarpon impressellum]